MKERTVFLIVTILVAGLLIGSLRTNITAAGSNPLIPGNESSDSLNPVVKKIEKIGHIYDVIQTLGGYVSVSKPDATTIVIRKTSTSGRRIWEKKFSLAGVSPVGIAQIADGYVFVGWYKGSGEYYYYDPDALFFIAIKNDGTVNWTKKFDQGFDMSSAILFNAVKSKPDGGFMVVGRRLLVNCTSKGDVLWGKRFKNLSFGGIESSHSVSDGFILQANSDRIFKVNDSGNIVWRKTLEIEGFSLHSIAPGSDNGFVVAAAGRTSSLLIGFNANGNVKWTETYSDFFINSNPVQTPDGGYALLGKTSGGRKSLLRINAKHDVVFQTIFDFRGTLDSIFAADNEGYVLYGSAPHFKQLNDMLFLRLNSKGIVPACGFFHNQTATKVVSPTFTREKLEITTGPFTLPAPAILEIDLVDSESTTTSACP